MARRTFKNALIYYTNLPICELDNLLERDDVPDEDKSIIHYLKSILEDSCMVKLDCLLDAMFD